MLHQMRCGFDDHRQARLVVAAQQGRAVAGDQRCAVQRLQGRVVCDVNYLPRIAGQDQVAASVVPNHLGLDIRP